VRSRFQNPNTLLLTVLVSVLGIVGAEAYLRNRPTYDARAEAKKRQKAFVETWKAPYLFYTPAPKFELPDLKGKRRSLKDLHDKPLVLALYSNDERSRVFAKEFQKIWDHLGFDQLNCVAVIDFPAEQAPEFIRATGDRALYLVDRPGEESVHRLYRTAPGPNAWLIDRKGQLLHATPPIVVDGVPEGALEGLYHALRGEGQVKMKPAAGPAHQ
jgi:peroxiredoxin